MSEYYYPYGGGRKAMLGEYISEFVYSVEYILLRLLRLKITCVDAYVRVLFGRVDNANLGDDLNFNFLPNISREPFIPFKYIRKVRSRLKDTSPIHYFIGSTFGMLEEPGSVVWGSGLLTEDQLPKIAPSIFAVRGPMTRERLVSDGILCPEVYGDPALLLPYYYQPKHNTKRYKLGIIPHYVDSDKEELQHFFRDSDVLIINVTGYDNWRSVVDRINSCDAIVSSSLHGIIISEAYGIPNIWAEIREPIVGDAKRRFKFYDFYASIGKNVAVPF